MAYAEEPVNSSTWVQVTSKLHVYNRINNAKCALFELSQSDEESDEPRTLLRNTVVLSLANVVSASRTISSAIWSEKKTQVLLLTDGRQIDDNDEIGKIALKIEETLGRAHAELSPGERRLEVYTGSIAGLLSTFPNLTHIHRSGSRSVPHASAILPNLYLGACSTAKSQQGLERTWVTHVVNCTKKYPNYHSNKDIEYFRVPVLDSIGEPIEDFLSAAFEFMDKALQKDVSSVPETSEAKSNDNDADVSMAGESIVLVHCEQGISRSTTVVLYYLMRKLGWSLEQSLAHAKEMRPIVAPNAHFMRVLEKCEEELRADA